MLPVFKQEVSKVIEKIKAYEYDKVSDNFKKVIDSNSIKLV